MSNQFNNKKNDKSNSNRFLKNFIQHLSLTKIITFLLGIGFLILTIIIVSYYFLGIARHKDQFDPTTLCLNEGVSNHVAVLIDQTSNISQTQALGVERRVKKIANEQVEQFGMLSVFVITRNNQLLPLGYICNPGTFNKIENTWVETTGLKKREILNQYKNAVTNLITTATNSAIGKPYQGKTYLMLNIKNLTHFFKSSQGAELLKIPGYQLNDNTWKKNWNDLGIDWLIIFSEMMEQNEHFAMRQLTAKNTPNMVDFWTDKNNLSLKTDLQRLQIGIYMFQAKTSKSDNSPKPKKNNKLRGFWRDYWQSQGANIVWFRTL